MIFLRECPRFDRSSPFPAVVFAQGSGQWRGFVLRYRSRPDDEKLDVWHSDPTRRPALKKCHREKIAGHDGLDRTGASGRRPPSVRSHTQPARDPADSGSGSDQRRAINSKTDKKKGKIKKLANFFATSTTLEQVRVLSVGPEAAPSLWPQCAGDRLPARRREAGAVVAWRAAWRPGATPTLMRNGRCCEYGSAAASWRCPSVLPRPIEPLGCDLLPGRAFRHPAWFVRRARWFEQKERGFFVDGDFVVVLTAWPAAMPYLCRGCVLLDEFMAEPGCQPRSAACGGAWF